MSFHQPYELHAFEPGETYFGDALGPEWQVSIYRSSMSDILEDCNFQVFLKRLGGECDTIKVHRVGFAGDGWYEFVAIHSANTAAIEKAKALLEEVQDYLMLDEDAFQKAEETYYESIGHVQNDAGEWVPAVQA